MAQAALDVTTSVAVEPEMALQEKVRSATMEAAEDIIYGSVSTAKAQDIERYEAKILTGLGNRSQALLENTSNTPSIPSRSDCRASPTIYR